MHITGSTVVHNITVLLIYLSHIMLLQPAVNTSKEVLILNSVTWYCFLFRISGVDDKDLLCICLHIS